MLFRSELLHLLLHRLAELAPGSVHDDHRLLALGGESVDVGGRREGLDRLARVPQVTVEGLLGALDVDAALGLGRAVLVDQPDEPAQPLARVAAPLTLVALELPVDELGDALALALGLGALVHARHGDRVLGVAVRGVALGVHRVVRHLVLGDVVEGVLERPVRDRVALGQATADGRVLELVDPRALEPLPAGAAVDHAVGVERLQAALEGLDLADLVILLDVLLPQVGAVLLVVRRLVTRRNALGAEDLGMKPYSFSIEARKGIVSSKRWKVSTTITLHLPVLR